MIVRTWGGRVPLRHADGFRRHLEHTGLRDYREQPGCVDAQVWRSDDGTDARFLLVSWWRDAAAMRRFAGDDEQVAVLYPGDERFELVPERRVTIYAVDHEEEQADAHE